MDAQLETLLREIHATDLKAVINVTGGATQALAWLLGVPGASNTVLEAHVPYSRDSLVELLGQEPELYCSETTALALAHAALRRAAALSPLGTPIAGVGATCALASEPPKRGAHRVHVAVVSGNHAVLRASLQLAKGARSRWQEDAVASRLVVAAVAYAALPAAPGSPQPPLPQELLDLQLITPGGPLDGPLSAAAGAAAAAAVALDGGATSDLLSVQLTAPPDPIQLLEVGAARCVEFAHGRVTIDAPRPRLVYLPGSFNPLHRGHDRLLAAAAARAGGRASCFELSIGNADKGLLAADEVRRRVAQFTQRGLPLLVTANAPLFSDKAFLAPGSAFVLGHDTVVRLLDPKYYGGSAVQMALVMDRMAQLGCSFLVAGRVEAGGMFRGLEDVDVPPELAGLFQGIPGSEFREDISSTDLRARAAADAAAAAAPAAGLTGTPGTL